MCACDGGPWHRMVGSVIYGYIEITERGFTGSKRFSFSFQGLRSGGGGGFAGVLGVCVHVCVCMCFSFHRDTKSTACRRGRERRRSRSHEVFWIKRLKPAHFSSLSVRGGDGEGEKSHNEIPQEQASGVIRGVGTQLPTFGHRNAPSLILAPCLFPLPPCALQSFGGHTETWGSITLLLPD